MFDFIKRWIWGPLKKDIVREWASDKIKEEEEQAIYEKKCKETPSFSKCVIDGVVAQRIEKRSQKQNHQLKSYKQAVKKTDVI
tara:strand:+ start:2933 stop:3181 length:249 start_codon:yes stop_codon:yes gene_type:complete